MDDFGARTRWRDAGFWNHLEHNERDEAKRQEDKDEKEAGQKNERKVSEDDELVCRGANPRTGVVSPFIFGEGSGKDWHNLEISARKADQTWVDNSLECRQVANVSLIPITQNFDREPSCAKSSEVFPHTKIWGRLNSEATSTREEKIQEYQGNLTDVCRSKTQNAVRLTPITSLNPPPTKQHIHRKKVGSGRVQKEGSKTSDLCKSLQDSSKEVSMTDISVFGRSTVSSIESGTAPFKALMGQPNGNLEHPATIRGNSIATRASKTNPAVSGKCIARLHFLQPTHGVSLTTPYRHSAQILAIEPRSIDSRERQNIGSTSTGDTSCKPWKLEQRPQVCRKFGTTSIPTLDFHEPELEDESRYFLSLTPQRNAWITKQRIGADRIDSNLRNHVSYQGCAMSSQGREEAKVPGVRPRPNRQCLNVRTEYLSKPVDILDHNSSTDGISSLGHSQSPIDRPKYPNGDIHVGKKASREILRTRTESRPEKLEKTPSRPMPDTGFAFSVEVPDQDWLMGLRSYTTGDQVKKSCSKFVEQKRGDLSYPDYFAQRLVEAWGNFSKAECSFTSLFKIEYISKWLLHMIRHTISTLHHSSPAMQIIGTSNPMVGEYIRAMISVLLAVLYLLVLLNILIALGKIVKLMMKTLWLIWFPIKVVVLLLKWCSFG